MGIGRGSLCCAIVFLFGVIMQVCALSRSNALDIEGHIRKRSLRENGYDNFQLASLKFTYDQDEIKHSFTNSRHVRDTKQQGTVELQIVGEDEQFEILLDHAKSVLNKDIQVVVVSDGNKQNTAVVEQNDCFMSGSLKSRPGATAVISYCNGLIGGFSNGSHYYFIETTDTTESEKIILARKKMTILSDDYKHINDDHQADESVTISKTNMGERSKRAVESLVVETVVILDEEYVAKIRAAGLDTNQSIYDIMELKWTGVQAEWAKVDVFDYDIRFDIKKIEIWESNPSWYAPSTVLDNTLHSICTNTKALELWADYDHVHLFTGRSGTDVSGKAYRGKLCTNGGKCAVSTDTSIAEYFIPAHEIGHCFGMVHDGDLSFTCLPAGIMGSSFIGWSNCSVEAFNLFLGSLSPNCLQVTDVLSESTNITLEAVWPGMVYTDDEVCELQNGPGFVHKGSMNSCGGYTCINLDPSSDKYGVSFRYTAPIDGRYCGEDMVCTTDGANYRCINVADTGISASLITKVTGGWSVWGSQTSCSRTCGTGIKYRQRTCTNPKPQNNPWCDGDEYDAELCNTQACAGDSSNQNELITQRAGETCENSKTNKLYSHLGQDASNYLSTGNKYGNNEHDQCDVKCDTVEGYTAANSERHGTMPHGTPCTLSSLSTFVETNNLPRKSGMYGTCVQGHCYQIGCDDKSGGTQFDGCGVCGGDNSTCQIEEGIYDTVLAPRERGLIVRLPTNASLIQFYFKYGDMSSHFFELKMKDAGTSEFGTSVISAQTLTTLDNPVSFAGTYWYLLWSKQYLYAQGPTNQAIDVVLYNYNSGTSKNNTGVNYAYTLPLDSSSCTGTCENDGTWNTSTCSCDCVVGYYGISCETTCKKYCKNSQPLKTSGCNCDCQGNTYGTSCNCRYPFEGLECQDCKKTSCQNGGTFNATACRCDCPQGFGDLDCGTTCKDVRSTEDCLVRVGKGHCESKNEDMEAKCYKSCGLCTPSDTTTTTMTSTTTTTTGGSSTENCTATSATDCNSGAGTLLNYGSFVLIPGTSEIHWSQWLLLIQTILLILF